MSVRTKEEDYNIIKGLNRDYAHDKYPKGLSTFTLNGIMEDFTGNIGNISSEPGNSLFHTLDNNYSIIGAVNLNRTSTLLILTNNTVTEIGISKSSSSYETLIKSTCFGYTDQNYVKGIFRLLNGCDRVVYLYDGVNPDKAINIDQLKNYHTSNTLSEANSLDTWNCSEMNLQPDYKSPYLSNFQVSESGGNLKLGSYSIAVEILDDGLNRISLTSIPTQVIIYDDNIGSAYRQIDGGLNLETSSATVGGVPPTTKSIRFDIENLDTNFTYYRIYVLRKTTHDGSTIEVFKKGELNNIRSSSDSYTLTTISSENGDTRTSIDEIFINPAFYKTSQSIIEVDNRLVRANVKSKNRDYSSYQRAVNQWIPKYTVKKVKMRDTTSLGNPKNPNTYEGGTTFVGGEIYSASVVFVHEDGEESFAFPIVGREATLYDKSPLTVVSGNPALNQVALEDVKHLGKKVGDTVLRYKVFDTADSNGTMAYHESDSGTYPLTKDCNGQYIYGELAGKPIRHLKFPTRNTIPLWEENEVNLLGLTFENIVYPTDDIIGHYILLARRSDFNRTVIDKGYVVRKDSDINIFAKPGDGYTSGIFGGNFEQGVDTSSSYYQVLRPNRLFLNSYNTSEFVKLEGQIKYNGDPPLYNTSNQTFEVGDFEHSITVVENDSILGRFDSTQEDNRLITQKLTLDRNQGFGAYLDFSGISLDDWVGPGPAYKPADDIFDISVANYNWLNSIELFKTNTPVTQAAERYEYFYTSFRVNRDVYSNLDSIIYYKTHTNILTESDTSELYIGDALISELTYQDAYFTVQNDSQTLLQANTNSVAYSGLYIETPINMELRHAGIQQQFVEANVSADCSSGTYYKGYADDPYKIHLKFMYLNTTGEYQYLSQPCGEFYGYNQDYTVGFRDKAYLSPGVNFNYCDQCKNNYVNRIVWSARSLTDEKVDNYRVFLTNDYTVVGTNPITNLYYTQNRLLVTSTDEAFVMAPNPRVMQTDSESVYLTTGDFLSIPARDIVKTDVGYGGNQGRFNGVASKFGYTYVDQQYGEVYNMTTQLETLSDKGLKQWFKSNLPCKLTQVVPEFLNTDNNKNGVGIISGFDPRYNRLILHKRDFQPIASIWGGTDPIFKNQGFMYFNSSAQKFYQSTLSGDIEVTLGDPDYFVNKSWTLSYAYEYGAWISFHSYMPDFIYSDVFSMYTTASNTIWKHSDRSFLSFYNKKYPFIVEFINVTPASSNLDVVTWDAKARVYNTNTGQFNYYINKTFNKCVIYNDQESTGEITLRYLDKSVNPYGNTVGWSNTKDVIYSDDQYKLTEFRAITKGNNSNWSVIRNKFEEYGYIDKIPNTPTIINQYKMSDITSTHNHVRLIFEPDEDDTQLVVDMINTKNFYQDV